MTVATKSTVLHNVLVDELISIRLPDASVAKSTLPGVLAHLSRGDDIDFRRLRPHQRHAWYSFLVQLACLGLVRAERADPPKEEESWRALLLGLESNQAAWSLVVDDITEPALLQPPAPEGDWSAYKKELRTPDEIDVLVTTKNHDLKESVVSEPDPEHWLLALVSLQTMSGYIGRGHYGIARMNGGFGTRVCVATVPDHSWTHRFLRDVPTVLETRAELLGGPWGFKPDGTALLWTEPWDGRKQSTLPVNTLDPFFIEVARRVRLRLTMRRIVAMAASTKGARVEASSFGGYLGDPWVPVDKEKAKPLTVSANGFSYRLLHELIGGADYAPSAAQELPKGATGRQYLLAQALVRGQGTTDGYRERWVPIPAPVLPLMREDPDELGKLAAARVDAVSDITRRMLRPAVCTLLQGAPEKLDFTDDRAYVWTRAFDEQIDRIFFDRLWRDVMEDDVGHVEHRRWKREAIGIGGAVLQDAIGSAPIPHARHYRAITSAEGVYWGSAHKLMPEAFVDDTEDETPKEVA